jgi:hypothetical protein
MSINSKGAIWFFLTAITLGIFSNWLEFKRTGNGVAFRRAYVLTLLAFATFSYFLGRSHENNILNLSPYILLVLLSIRTEQMPKILRSIPAAMLAGLIGWCGFFVWNAWVAVYGASSSLMLGHEYILPAFTDEATALRQYGTSPHNRFSVNVSRAIVDIKSRYGEPVTVIRNLSKSNLTAWESDAVWSAIHGPDLFESVPSASRRVFLARTAKTLNRNGWLIIEKGYDAKEWILDFESVYTRKEEFDLGNYLAIRYVPGKR